MFTNLPALAIDTGQEDMENLYKSDLQDLINIEVDAKANVGSRDNKAIDLLKTSVPIDVITSEQINHTGYTEFGRVLQRFIPGFNFSQAYVSDGSSHINAFTLRGMASDQVLVLVNGKRLHASALLHVNDTIGRGATGVDLNSIPLSSVERVEVLRDGAAAQYGSDAIAGIINIVLKSGDNGNRFTTTVGQTYAGDGELYKTDIHYGISLPLDGFFNITAELRDRHPTNRSKTSHDENSLDNGINKVQEVLGSPEKQDFLLALNSELPFSDAIIFYLHGSINYRHSKANLFFRNSEDKRNVKAIYPQGFAPILNPTIIDYSSTLGIQGDTDFNLHWDLSHTIGGSRIDYHVKNSLNASLGAISPTSFDSGALSSRQHITNLDLFKQFDLGFNKPIKLALGLEWRYEIFNIIAGNEASYINGDFKTTMAGAQGFPGFSPDNELSEDRHNFSSYIDITSEVYDKWTLAFAGRYEYYSDFGANINGKIALNYQVFDSLLFRTSISTGFRAPSLQQSYYNATSSINIDDNLTSRKTLRVGSEVASKIGAKSLKIEKSQHFSAGFMYKPLSNFFVSGDYFYTKIKNRILLSRNIKKQNHNINISKILENNNLEAVNFFTNAINTETQGYDLRLNYDLKFKYQHKLNLSAAYNYNKTKIIGKNESKNISDIILSDFALRRLTIRQPHENIILTAHYKYNNFDSSIKMIKIGNHYITNKIQPSQWIYDIDLGYRFGDIKFSVGGHNVFDSRPNYKNDNNLLNTPYGYNGGFYYVRFSADF